MVAVLHALGLGVGGRGGEGGFSTIFETTFRLKEGIKIHLIFLVRCAMNRLKYTVPFLRLFSSYLVDF